jgi:hypothetical protein
MALFAEEFITIPAALACMPYGATVQSAACRCAHWPASVAAWFLHSKYVSISVSTHEQLESSRGYAE